MKFKYFFFFLSILALGFSSLEPNRQRGTIQARLDQFGLITADSGWVLLDQHLFWTSNEGETWDEIGPSIPLNATVQDVEFSDASTGWMLWSTVNRYGSTDFTLAQTIDHGESWDNRSLPLFESNEVSASSEEASMGWIDAQNGWIVIKQISGSNFSLGTLFTTSDGGEAWVRSTLPVADRVILNDEQTGWAVGGTTGGQVYLTQDKGVTWKKVDLGDFGSFVTAYEPIHENGQGLLVTTSLGSENVLNVYKFEDATYKWIIADKVSLDVEPGVIGHDILDPNNFVATIPGTNTIIQMGNGVLSTYENTDGSSSSIVELDMVSLNVGWARSVEANCVNDLFPYGKPASVSCESLTRLLKTNDGGVTWLNVRLPLVQSSVIPSPSIIDGYSIPINLMPNPGNTNILIGQGFDKCEIPTISQLQTWADNSPYQAVNLYIGGSSRACSNNALTTSYLTQLHQQGWQFIPTWVGPQAPCTGYLSRMSSDPATAFSQGVAEADLAVDRLAELGLTYPDKTGSIVYYDIEYYGTNAACREAVNAFMNGWVTQIHAHGNLAGVYGSTLCNTGLSDFQYITNVPDVIWPARWYHNAGEGYYDPSAGVWNLGSCIPNSVWADHQRIRQYEGDHDETWGDLTLGIDSNVLDGVVAIPYTTFQVSSITRAGLDPTNATSVDFTVTFSETVTGVDISDFTLTTTGVTGASISSVLDTGDQTSYTVTVNTGSGDGTIRLDLTDNDSIEDLLNNPLGGTGSGNGDFTLGEIYTVQNIPSFEDVPVNHPYWPYIEILYANSYTGGCSITPQLFCPNLVMDRAQSAVFMLRGNYGSGYTPVTPTHIFADNWSRAPWAEGWAESMYLEGLTAGCLSSPLTFCPYDRLTNVQAAVFGLRLKYGMAYLPPMGTGTVFADMTDTSFWGLGWAEQAFVAGIIPSCGTGVGGKPNFCPNALVDRGFGSYVIVTAKNLSMP